MAALDRIVSMILRAAQIGFAVIVAAIVGAHLHRADSSAWSLARFIYTEVVAGISIFLGLIWLLPFSSALSHWPVDIFVSALWWVAFGLLVNASLAPDAPLPRPGLQRRPIMKQLTLSQLVGTSCGAVFDWQNVAPRGDECGRSKANIAFTFLSAVVWLASAAIGVFWVRRHERRNVAARSRV